MAHWSGLREIPWRSFRHAYGDASDIPRTLRRLLSADLEQRRDAQIYLHHSLVHQGLDRGPATAHAADFVVRLLGDPAVRDRDRLIELLIYFAVGEPKNWHYFVEGYDLDECFGPGGAIEYGWLKIDDPSYGPAMRDLFSRVSKGLPLYLELLTSRSTRIRRAVPALLGWLAQPSIIVPALVDRLMKERDPIARGSLALGLAGVGRLHAEARPALEAAFERARRSDERFLVAVALLRLGGAPSAKVLRFLLSALPKPHDMDGPWRVLDLPDFLFALVLLRAPASRPRLFRAGLRALRSLPEAPELAVFLVDKVVRNRAEARALRQLLARRPDLLKWSHVTQSLERLPE